MVKKKKVRCWVCNLPVTPFSLGIERMVYATRVYMSKIIAMDYLTIWGITIVEFAFDKKDTVMWEKKISSIKKITQFFNLRLKSVFVKVFRTQS